MVKWIDLVFGEEEEVANRWKKKPKILERIQELMRHDTAGDTITGLKWTRKTTEKLAAKLYSIHVSPTNVGRLLKDLDFRLRVNFKAIESGNRKQKLEFFRIKFPRKSIPPVIIQADT